MHIARAQDEHAIAMLTGQPPASLNIGARKIGGPPPPIPVAVPSQLLERRPDIAANERQVAAANANVGLAEAAYYPTLTLSASPGFIATNLANLVTYASRSWSAGPSLSQTLFDFGRRGAALESAEAAYDATVAAYRQTVLSAFQEVEDDLSNLRYLAEEAVHEQEAVVASQEALSLEMDRYRAGTDSYLNVITTQIIALGDQQTAITILQRRMSAAVDLVKALGGGWDASTLPSAQCSSFGRAGRSEEHAKRSSAGRQIGGTELCRAAGEELEIPLLPAINPTFSQVARGCGARTGTPSGRCRVETLLDTRSRL